MDKATKAELIRKADQYREQALAATPGERTALLRKARNYYEDAGNGAWAKWCEARMG